MTEPQRLRVTRLDSLVVNKDHTVTGTFLTDGGDVLTARFIIDERGNGNVIPDDFFTPWDGTAESVRSVIHAASSILRAHDLSRLPDSR
ncbi:MAG: hypothetical protein U0Q22_04360 [Acidimicrobiales bacterium]